MPQVLGVLGSAVLVGGIVAFVRYRRVKRAVRRDHPAAIGAALARGAKKSREH